MYQDCELANEAFLQAQLIDIENPLSWISKAIVAKAEGLPKLEDLTDQALQLSQGTCVSRFKYLNLLSLQC
jgi:hypothetical protein